MFSFSGQPVTRLLMLFDDEESDDQPEFDDPEEQSNSMRFDSGSEQNGDKF